MELNQYVCLLPEQKVTMIQKDLKGAARDLKIWQRAQNIYMGEAFREVNTALRRSPWRSAEDYALVDAVLNYEDIKNGHMDQAPGPDDVLDMHLDVLHDDIEFAMNSLAPKADKPRRGDAVGLVAFWEEHANLDGVSDADKTAQASALTLFWNKDAFHGAVNHNAFRDQMLKQENGVIASHGMALRQAIETMADWVPHMHGHVANAVKFYNDYKPFYARIYNKTEAEKTALINEEKIRLAHLTMIQKAEESLRPEGRHHNLKRAYALRQGTYVAPEWTPPVVVSLYDKTKQDVTAYLQKHGIDKKWHNARNYVSNINWGGMNPFRKTKTEKQNDAAGRNAKKEAKEPTTLMGRQVKKARTFLSRNKLSSFVAVAGLSVLGVAYYVDKNSPAKPETKNGQNNKTQSEDARYNLNSSDPFKPADDVDDDRSYDYDAIRARVLQEYLDDSLDVEKPDSIKLDEQHDESLDDDHVSVNMSAYENMQDIAQTKPVQKKALGFAYAMRL